MKPQSKQIDATIRSQTYSELFNKIKTDTLHHIGNQIASRVLRQIDDDVRRHIYFTMWDQINGWSVP